MIAYLKGQVLDKTNRSIIILVGGVGYEIFVRPKDVESSQQGQEQEWFIHSHIKEDMFDLYGFKNLEQLDFFKKVISVSGIGPKSAMNVLALAEVSNLKKAISQGDTSFLQQVSGIGKKTAERLVLELREKFINDLSGVTESVVGDDRQVVNALVSLGYQEREAIEIVRSMPAGDGDLAAKVKQALKYVSK